MDIYKRSSVLDNIKEDILAISLVWCRYHALARGNVFPKVGRESLTLSIGYSQYVSIV